MKSTPVPTRARQRRDTRNLILKVALDEIAEVGLAKTCIEHIARKAGVTRPTIYVHFPRKEDFLLALQARTEEATRRVLAERLGDESGAVLIHRLVDVIFDLVDSSEPKLRREAFALIIREPQQVDWKGNVLFGFLAERVERAQLCGDLAADLPAAKLTRVIMTALFGFLIVENESARARRRDAHEMLDLVIGGVRQ